MSEDDIKQLVEELYEISDVSEDAARETTVDEKAELAYLPQEALVEIAEYAHSLRAEADRDE